MEKLRHISERLDVAEDRLALYFDKTPRRRWVRNIFRGFNEHQDTRAASAMAFHLFLAMIPMLAFAGWLAGNVIDRSPESLQRIMIILDVAPGDVKDVFRQHFGRLSSSAAMAPLALAGTMWLTSDAFHTMITVFESAVFGERRPWWKKRLIGLGCALLVMALVPLIGWVAVELAGGPIALLHFIRSADDADKVLARWIALAIAAVLGTVMLAGFFRIAVSRPGVKRRVFPGAIMTVTIGSAASVGFATYAEEIASYTVFYGSLAAVAVILVWLWILCMAILLGAELNAQLEGVQRLQAPSSRPSLASARAGRPPVSERAPASEPASGAEDEGSRVPGE